MGFQSMLDDFDESDYLDSTELSKERSWQLANKIIASALEVSQLKTYQSNFTQFKQALESDLQDSLAILEGVDPKTKEEMDVFVEGLLDRLKSSKLHKLIENKTVVGVGGRFSSGKSSLLNTLFMGESDLKLPEAQDATTSVPTFIVNTTQDQNQAHLCNRYGVKMAIDDQELSAISHGFKKRFGLGLSEFISFIDVSSKLVPKNVVMLDTPGYSKSNTDHIEALSDFTKAYKQLRSVDYLIWAFDITNGTITDDDFKFIKGLAPRKQILFVACKSDLKSPADCDMVIAQAKSDAERRLAEFGCSLFDIVPFSAFTCDPNSPEVARINDFLKVAQNDFSSRDSLSKQLQNKLNEVEQMLQAAYYKSSSFCTSFSSFIKRTSNIQNVQNLIKTYQALNAYNHAIQSKQQSLGKKTSLKCLSELVKS